MHLVGSSTQRSTTLEIHINRKQFVDEQCSMLWYSQDVTQVLNRIWTSTCNCTHSHLLGIEELTATQQPKTCSSSYRTYTFHNHWHNPLSSARYIQSTSLHYVYVRFIFVLLSYLQEGSPSVLSSCLSTRMWYVGKHRYTTTLTFYSLPVTWCTNSLTFNNCTFCSHCMCFVLIWEQTATCATYSINWLVFITEMKSVYCAVRTGSLNEAICASCLISGTLLRWMKPWSHHEERDWTVMCQGIHPHSPSLSNVNTRALGGVHMYKPCLFSHLLRP